MKKIVSLIFLLCCFCCTFCPVATALANPTFYYSGLSGSVGDTVTLTIGIKEAVPDVGGLNLSCTYDDNEITYVAGSRKLLNSAMQSGDLNPDQATVGNVSFLWSSDRGAEITGDIVSFQFIVLKSTSSLRIRINEMFKNDANYTDIIDSILVINPAPDITENAAVTAVIAKIDAIGTVENTAACKEKIDAARKVYNALTVMEREAVTNYATLTAAELEYDRLQSGSNDPAEAVSAFKSKHSVILAKTVDTVTTTDETAVETAITDWNALATAEKLRLVTEKNLLNTLQTKIAELKASEQEQQEVLEEAQGFLAEFKNTYGSLLDIKYEDIDSNYYEAFYTAKNALAEYADMNTQFSALASDEIEKIDRYYARALELKAKNEQIDDPAVEEAQKFQNTYGWILGMEEDAVSRDDLADLSVSAYAYSLLSDSAKKLLPGAEAHISALIAKAESETEESEPETITVEKIVTNTVEKEVKVPVEQEVKTEKSAAVMLNAVVPGLNPTVWWLMISAGILLVICGGLTFLYFYSKKQEVNESCQK